MSEIIRRILGHWKPRVPSTIAVHIAAFGKHPAWGDLIEERPSKLGLGVDSDRLIEVMRALIDEGIKGNVVSEAWDSLPADHRLNGYDHCFVWSFATEAVVGRMWSSKDSTNRSKYPMVVCAQVESIPAATTLSSILDLLERLKDGCQMASTKEDVIATLLKAREELRANANLLLHATSPTPRDETDPIAAIANCNALADNTNGLLGILYLIRPDRNAYRHGTLNSGNKETGGRPTPPRPFQLRVPWCVESSSDALWLWWRFVAVQLGTDAQVLAIIPLGQSWVDVIIGPPEVGELFCIRASRVARQLTTDKKYILPDSFLDDARRFLQTHGVTRL